MKYYIVGFIQGHTKWYLSIVDPSKGQNFSNTLSPELAVKFHNKQEAIAKIQAHILNKKVRGTFVCEMNVTFHGGVAA